LRVLKSRKLTSNRRNHDVLTSLAMMKSESNFNNILKDMGSYPFFIHYHSPEQIQIYRNYCKTVDHPRIIIDATGSVVKKFMKFGLDKTRSIFLYEVLVYDSNKCHSFTVTNMISESHTTLSIFNWLAKLIRCDIPSPKEFVSDQSLALLSAAVQCFTQFSSLKDYIQICSDLVTGIVPSDSYWLPRCFIRTDVAHFIKLVCKWAPLKLLAKRVREIIIRSIGVILKSHGSVRLG